MKKISTLFTILLIFFFCAHAYAIASSETDKILQPSKKSDTFKLKKPTVSGLPFKKYLKHFGTSNSDWIHSAKMDSNGNIHLVGSSETISSRIGGRRHSPLYVIIHNDTGEIEQIDLSGIRSIEDESTIRNPLIEWIWDIVFDNEGNVYLAAKTDHSARYAGTNSFAIIKNPSSSSPEIKFLNGRSISKMFLDKDNNYLYAAGEKPIPYPIPTRPDGEKRKYYVAKFDLNTPHLSDLSPVWEFVLTSNQLFRSWVDRLISRPINMEDIMDHERITVSAMSLDASGDVYVAGKYNTEHEGKEEVDRQYILKLSAENGSVLENKLFGSADNTIYDLTVNTLKNAILVGTDGRGDAENMLVKKFNWNFGDLWSWTSGDDRRDSMHFVATDSSDNIYAAGIIYLPTEDRIFSLYKFGNDGSIIRSTNYDIRGAMSSLRDILLDDRGNLFVIGQTLGNLNGEITNQGYYDVFVIKFDKDLYQR